MTNCLPYFHMVFLLENFIQVISHSFVKYYFLCDFVVFQKPLRPNWGKVCCRQACFFLYLYQSSDYVLSGQM